MFSGSMFLLVGALGIGLFAIVGAVFAFRSLFKQRASRNYLEQAKKSLWEGREIEALKQFLKAEKRWELNSHDGGRGSLVKDLDQYIAIAGGVIKIVGKNASQVRSNITGLVAEMNALLKDRNNFGIDGRKMKPDSAMRWQAMCERLEIFRAELRGCCQPALYH